MNKRNDLADFESPLKCFKFARAIKFQRHLNLFKLLKLGFV